MYICVNVSGFRLQQHSASPSAGEAGKKKKCLDNKRRIKDKKWRNSPTTNVNADFSQTPLDFVNRVDIWEKTDSLHPKGPPMH